MKASLVISLSEVILIKTVRQEKYDAISAALSAAFSDLRARSQTSTDDPPNKDHRGNNDRMKAIVEIMTE